MTKTRKTYRLSDETLTQMAWLQDDTGLDATAVVTLAVAELFRQRHHMHLVESDNGGWSLVMGKKPVIKISDETLDLMMKSEPDLISRLRAEGLPMGEALVGFGVTMLLARAQGNDTTLFSVTDGLFEAESQLLNLGDTHR